MWDRRDLDLFGDHAACVGETLHGFEVRRWIVAHGDFVFAAFAGEDGPQTADAFALPGAAEESFSVAIVIVAAEPWAVGSFDADGGIDYVN